jgi:hypothetical protein
MKDVIVLAGGKSERGLLLRGKLSIGQYDVILCRLLTDSLRHNQRREDWGNLSGAAGRTRLKGDYQSVWNYIRHHRTGRKKPPRNLISMP